MRLVSFRASVKGQGTITDEDASLLSLLAALQSRVFIIIILDENSN